MSDGQARYTPFDSQSYISGHFTTYCKSHMENPVAPFEMYKGFLTYAKDHKRFGWMNLAKMHRAELLRVAFRLQAKVYGFETMKALAQREKQG